MSSIRVVGASKRLPPQKLVKDIQTLLAVMVYFEVDTKKQAHVNELYDTALKYYQNNVKAFVRPESDVQAEEGKHFLTPAKCLRFTSDQLVILSVFRVCFSVL